MDFPQQKPSIWGYPHDYGKPAARRIAMHLVFKVLIKRGVKKNMENPLENDENDLEMVVVHGFSTFFFAV